MKLAWIPPISMLEVTERTDYQLVLPHLLLEYPQYLEHYKRSDLGYKILDNGEAEGLPVSPSHLMNMAHAIGADEIVVPDVIGNWEGTLQRVRLFADVAEQYPEFKYMAVLQGETIAGVIECLDRFLNDVDYINTIAIPRHMVKRFGPRFRVGVAEDIASANRQREKSLEIHCLGAEPTAIMEVADLAASGVVRGMDTSTPIFVGLWGFDIKRDYLGSMPQRHDAAGRGYFDMTCDTEEERTIVNNNIATFHSWAEAT